MSLTEIEISKKFERKNEEVRAYYVNYKECETELRDKINELVQITHEENPEWSLNKIVNFICVINEDLDGFSKTNVRDNVTEEKESSSRTTTNEAVIDGSYDVRLDDSESESEGDIAEDPEVQYDNPETIIKQNRAYEELETKYSKLITPYEVKTTEIVNGQELPFIIKVDPDKRTTRLELDQKKVNKLINI